MGITCRTKLSCIPWVQHSDLLTLCPARRAAPDHACIYWWCSVHLLKHHWMAVCYGALPHPIPSFAKVHSWGHALLPSWWEIVCSANCAHKGMPPIKIQQGSRPAGLTPPVIAAAAALWRCLLLSSRHAAARCGRWSDGELLEGALDIHGRR